MSRSPKDNNFSTPGFQQALLIAIQKAIANISFSSPAKLISLKSPQPVKNANDNTKKEENKDQITKQITSSISSTKIRSPRDFNPLLKREAFAIQLRSKKRAERLQESRQKIR